MNPISSIKKNMTVLTLAALLSTAAGPSSAGTAPAPASMPVSIPEAWGHIDEFYQAPHFSKTILYIQDAHDSLEAQENISKIIGHLVERENIKTVFEEGYEGPVPTDSLFGFIKDPAIREKVSWFFLDKLSIGGAEHAHINRKKDFRLTGADSLGLHLENIEAYRHMAESQKKILRELDETQKEIRMLGDRFFPKEFKEWIKLKERFESHALPLPDYLRRTLDAARKKNRRSSYPLLEKTLGPQAFAGKIDSADSNQLFQEMDTLENDIARSFLSKERDYMIFQHYKHLSLMKRLAEMKLTPEEVSAAAPALKSAPLRQIASFIAAESGKSLALSTAWQDSLPAALRFYELAHRRDKAVEIALSAWSEKTEEKISVLVFGGFHKKNLTAAMRTLGFSYAVISPKISVTDKKHQLYYKQLMTGGVDAFESGLSASAYNRPPTLFLRPEQDARAQVNNVYKEAVDYPERPSALLGRSRAENRSASIHESMVSPLIYPRFILSAPPNAPYTRENFLEAPVKPMPERERAMKTFQAVLEQYSRAGENFSLLRDRYQRMLVNTTILAVDLPTIFYSPSRPLTLGHIIQISGKRRAILLPKKLLEFSAANSPLELRKLAAYLDIGQQLIERYDEVSEYFRYENQSFRIGIQQAEAVDRMVSETASHAVYFSAVLTGPFFNPAQPNFPFLVSADDALWREERQRLTQREEKMLENYQGIGEALQAWNPKNGYSDAQIQRVSKKIALLIPEMDPAVLLARKDPRYNWQQPALTVIQRTLQSFQKRGFYYETEGKNNLAVDYYDKAAHLYRASQKIDFGGLFPLKAQEELAYFRLRTAGVEGQAGLKRRLETFAHELRRAIKIEYTPEIRRKFQQASHDLVFPIWLTLSAPDLYSKLQHYRPLADEATLELIDRIERMLRRTYFSELKRLASAENKFGVNLVQTRKNKLQNPLLLPVPESGDVFSFSWKKTDIVPGEHIAVRVMAHRWLGGPEIQDLAGYYHFELKKGPAGWRAYSAVGEWPGSTIKNVPGSAMVIDDYALRYYEELPYMLSQLALRLARRSGAIGFQIKLPVEIQEKYELPYSGPAGKRSPKLWVPNLQSNPMVDKRVVIKPRETRNEARNIGEEFSLTAQEPAALFVSYADLQNPGSPLRKILFGMAYEIRAHKNTSLVIYGADLSDESLKPFREVGVHIEAAGLSTARRHFGLEKNPERNVHFSLTAETLKKNLREPLLAFLSQNPADVYAALLLARSGGIIPGVNKKDGIYSLDGEILKAALAKHLQQLAVAIAA